MNPARVCSLLLVLPLAAWQPCTRVDADTPSLPAKEPLDHGKTLSYWIDKLKSPDGLVCEEAAEVVSSLGATARGAVPALKELLKHDLPSVRSKAAMALWRIDGYVAERELTDGLRDPAKSVRLDAARALAQIGPAARAAAGALVELLNDSDATVRAQAGRALRHIGEPAVPALLRGLKHPEAAVRRQSVSLLADIAPPEREVAAAMLDKLQDKDTGVRIEAAEVLWESDRQAPGVIPAVVELLQDRDVLVRRRA